MAIHFNHTILPACDSQRLAMQSWPKCSACRNQGAGGPFTWSTQTENDENLDYMDTDGEIEPQHYAFPYQRGRVLTKSSSRTPNIRSCPIGPIPEYKHRIDKGRILSTTTTVAVALIPRT